MFANIVLVLVITVIAARPEHYWQALLGYLGITFLMQGYPPACRQTDALALYGQPGGSVMFVSFWVIAAGFGHGPLRRPGRPARSGRPRRSPPRSSRGTQTTPPSAPRCSSGRSSAPTA